MDIKKDIPINMDEYDALYQNQPKTIISCENINYTVEIGGLCCAKKEEKEILKNIRAVFKPGLNAILGQSGSGKTTLINVLAGRAQRKRINGDVLIDGETQPKNLKYMAGYVIQEDIVNDMLTVRENIQFSAALRLPSNISQGKRNQQVNDIIDELELTSCADNRIGTQLNRGVSGGERKRTNIGMELITSPSILFLDEPTTGLDANTAYSVIHILKCLSQKGRTIIFSIHQPRYSILKLLDYIMLVSHGETVFWGPAAEALSYFKKMGYECEKHNNPTDFFLDVISGAAQKSPNYSSAQFLHTPASNGCLHTSCITLSMNINNSMERHHSLVKHFSNSTQKQNLDEELKKYSPTCPTSNNTKFVPHSKTNWIKQLSVVSKRCLQSTSRNPVFLIAQIITNIFLGLVVGTIYFQVDSESSSAIKNRVGAFFFMVMNHVFSNLSFVDVFISDRVLFFHEWDSGYYSVSVYFISKLLGFVLPIRFLPLTIFSLIAYWMIGLQATLTNFLLFLLNTFTSSLAGTSAPLFISASVGSNDVAMILVCIIWVFMIIFGGVLVDVSTVPVWLRWMQFCSIFRYSLNFYTINELKDAVFCNRTLPFHQNTSHIECWHGNDYMYEQGIGYETSWDLWKNQVGLVVITLLFFSLTYVQLRRSLKR